MKKLFLFLWVTSIIVPAFTFASIDANLKYGARGPEVVELQEFLIANGFLSGEATGNFYSLTRQAVIAYQQNVGLPASGFVGPLTRAQINKVLAEGDVSTSGAEIAETGKTSAPVAESPVDLLKKQVALLMQQIQTMQQQASTTNQILQNQQSQIATQNQQTQQTQQQLSQLITNTTPPPPPAPKPEPKRDIQFTAKALNPTKLGSPWESIDDGGTVYKSVTTGLGPNIPDGVAQVRIYADYVVDGVKQNTYSGQWSYTPWDFNILGSDNKQTTFAVNCPQGSVSGNVCSMLMGGTLTITGPYAFTATVDGISKSFTVNVKPNPICAGISAEECAVGYDQRVASSTPGFGQLNPTFTGTDLNPVAPPGRTGYRIGSLAITKGDEDVKISRIEFKGPASQYLSYFFDGKYGREWGSGQADASGIGVAKTSIDGAYGGETDGAISVDIPADAKPGVYAVTITNIKATGMLSGLNRNINGLPITFHYTVQ